MWRVVDAELHSKYHQSFCSIFLKRNVDIFATNVWRMNRNAVEL